MDERLDFPRRGPEANDRDVVAARRTALADDELRAVWRPHREARLSARRQRLTRTALQVQEPETGSWQTWHLAFDDKLLAAPAHGQDASAGQRRADREKVMELLRTVQTLLEDAVPEDFDQWLENNP